MERSTVQLAVRGRGKNTVNAARCLEHALRVCREDGFKVLRCSQGTVVFWCFITGRDFLCLMDVFVPILLNFPDIFLLSYTPARSHHNGNFSPFPSVYVTNSGIIRWGLVDGKSSCTPKHTLPPSAVYGGGSVTLSTACYCRVH